LKAGKKSRDNGGRGEGGAVLDVSVWRKGNRPDQGNLNLGRTKKQESTYPSAVKKNKRKNGGGGKGKTLNSPFTPECPGRMFHRPKKTGPGQEGGQ